MAIVPWSPLRWGLKKRGLPSRGVPVTETGIEDFFDHFERAVEALWRRAPTETRGWGPAIDIIDQPDEILARAELPGMKKEDIHVSVTGDMLTIEGERKVEEKVEEKDYYCCEGSYGKFHREFMLPVVVHKEKIISTYKDGILEVHLPKAEEVKPKEIEVQVE